MSTSRKISSPVLFARAPEKEEQDDVVEKPAVPPTKGWMPIESLIDKNSPKSIIAIVKDVEKFKTLVGISQVMYIVVDHKTKGHIVTAKIQPHAMSALENDDNIISYEGGSRLHPVCTTKEEVVDLDDDDNASHTFRPK